MLLMGYSLSDVHVTYYTFHLKKMKKMLRNPQVRKLEQLDRATMVLNNWGLGIMAIATSIY
jgi:hypothetical protein